jgi:hypothetical protein
LVLGSSFLVLGFQFVGGFGLGQRFSGAEFKLQLATIELGNRSAETKSEKIMV